MIIIDKWSQLPTVYDIIFPIYERIDINWFYDVVDALYSDSDVYDYINCNTNLDSFIDGGDSTDGEGETSTAKLTLIKDGSRKTYNFDVYPFKSNLLFAEFYLEITEPMECGEYTAYLQVGPRIVGTMKFKIKMPKKPYDIYNPERNIIIYEG